MAKRLIFDLETRSRAEIADVGAWNYSCDPSTQVLCGAFTTETGDVVCYDLTDGHIPKEWEQAVAEGWEIWAFNTSFEYSILTNVLKHWPQPKASAWMDAQYVACINARPASLEKCAKALGLDEQKMSVGKSLINFFCKPATTGSNKGEFRDPAQHPDRFQELMAYCAQDVRTTVAVLDALRPLSDAEREFWRTSWATNTSGMAIDRPLCDSLITLLRSAKILIGEKLQTETGVDPAELSNHRKILQYVNEAGLVCTSITKAAVKEALAGDVPTQARSILEARQAFGKSAVEKLHTIRNHAGSDNRLRFMLRPHGTYTGRDSGQGVQPQSLPRGEKGFKPEELIRLALQEDPAAFFAAAHQKSVFNPLGAISACIRGVFCAEKGKVLLQCDWSAIEPRIGAWLVGDAFMLDAFRKIDREGGFDIYQLEAARFYGCDPSEIVGERRQMGKVFVLQNQYESSEFSIQKAAKEQYGLNLDIDTCIQAKDVWRVTHPKWVAMWRSLNDGAIAATRHPGNVIRCGKIAYCHSGRDLRMRLPCGRLIAFPDATIKKAKTPWGSLQDSLHFYGVVHNNWAEDQGHGGAFFNTAVQGIGASLMRYAANNLETAGIPVVLRVHDELIVEVDSESMFQRFKSIMLQPPPWAPDLPINGAGYCAVRYKKD